MNIWIYLPKIHSLLKSRSRSHDVSISYVTWYGRRHDSWNWLLRNWLRFQSIYHFSQRDPEFGIFRNHSYNDSHGEATFWKSCLMFKENDNEDNLLQKEPEEECVYLRRWRIFPPICSFWFQNFFQTDELSSENRRKHNRQKICRFLSNTRKFRFSSFSRGPLMPSSTRIHCLLFRTNWNPGWVYWGQNPPIS